MEYRTILIIFLLLTPSVYAMELESGKYHTIYEIPKCYGEVNVRVSNPELNIERTLQIQNCTKQQGNNWICECDEQGFNLSFYTHKKTTNTYNFLISYLTENVTYEANDELEPTWEQIKYDAYTRTERVNNVTVRPAVFVMTDGLDDNIRYTVMVVIGVFLILILFFYFKGKKSFKVKDNDDILNYSNKKDEDISDILNNIK